MTLRSEFVKSTIEFMASQDKVVLLLGDISVYAFREAFERWPDRCFNLGCAEQAMVGFAAGLAREGLYPIVHTIDPFLVRRAYEFIYLDFGVARLPGLFVTVGGARDYEAMGASHMCKEGADLMRNVPNMHITCLRNGDLERRGSSFMSLILRFSKDYSGPTYLRLEEQT